MVRLTRIYTRSGDKGKTSLGSGRRVAKDHARVEAYGAIDEANAVIGLARHHVPLSPAGEMLDRIQNDLFDVGADLCVPVEEGGKSALRVSAAQVARLEEEIDAMNATLPPLDSFILPGGAPASAHLHFARTVVRRAERRICGLARKVELNPDLLSYVNRLSDHLFVLARTLDEGDSGAKLWEPGREGRIK